MPTGCDFPEHHGRSGGFPPGLIAVAIAAVIICTSATTASIVHDLTIIILSAVAAVVVAGIAGYALWLHHQRAVVRAAAPRPIHMTARIAPGVPQSPRRAAATGPPGAPPAITAAPGEVHRIYVPAALRRGERDV